LLTPISGEFDCAEQRLSVVRAQRRRCGAATEFDDFTGNLPDGRDGEMTVRDRSFYAASDLGTEDETV
jgi:hypothetical protein